MNGVLGGIIFHVSCFLHQCHMSHLSCAFSFNDPNISGWRVQINHTHK